MAHTSTGSIATRSTIHSEGAEGDLKCWTAVISSRRCSSRKIDAVFTLCGGHIISIYNGLIDEGIRIVDFRHEQADRAVASALALLRYDEVVRALGGYGEFVEEPRAIRGALERVLAPGKPACVNMRIDAEANAAVSANSMGCKKDLEGIANLPGLFLFDAARAVWYDGGALPV